MRKMNRHGLLAKSMSYALSFALVFTSVDLSAISSFAAEKETETKVSTEVESVEVTRTITGVEALDEDVAYQTLKEKGSISDIVFPEELNVTVEEVTTTVTKTTTTTRLTKSQEPDKDKTSDVESDDADVKKEPAASDSTDQDKETVPENVTSSEEGEKPSNEIPGPSPDEEPVITDKPSEDTVLEKEDASPAVDAPADDVPAEEPAEDNSGSQEKETNCRVETSDSARLFIDFTRILDVYVPGTVYAAEDITDEVKEPSEEATEPETDEKIERTTDTETETITETLTGITWELDKDLSDKGVFTSRIADTKYVFRAVLSDDDQDEYKLSDEVELPTIKLVIVAKDRPAFDDTKTIGGVSVRVKADPGVFPEGATLSVRKVYFGERLNVEGAVDSVRDDGLNVAVSYTFDIKVLDEDGEEIEPDNSKGNVRVSFAMSEADNQNLSADVYHIGDDMNAEKLAASTTTEGGEPAVVAQTDGFSYYTVEFTYGDMQYVMEGDTEVPLQDVLDYVGIAGTVTNAYGSNDELFSAENRNGTWYLVAHKAFKTREWLKVTLDGVEMDVEIVVTDDAEKTYLFKPNGVWVEGGDQVSSYVYLNTNDTLKFEGSQGEGVGITIVFYRAFSDYQNKGTYYSGQKTVSELFGEKVLLDVHSGGTPGTYNFGRVITVNLNASGGTLGTTTFEASPSQAYFPDYVEIPTRPGYKFLGYYGTFNSEERMWYGADGKFEWAIYLIEDGFTLYAHWEVLASTVTLNANGGSGGPSPVTATYGSAMPAIASTNLPARTGYTFAGYYDTKTGGTQYYTSSGASARTWDKTANTTLYARWTANTYTVTLNQNGGSGGSGSVTATYDSAMPSATMPTRNGYVFQGYYDTNAQTGGTQYYTSSGASARTWNKTANTTLYARWKEIAAVSTAPEGISGLVYTSQPQALVTGGQVKNTDVSKMQYRLGTNGSWSDDIPTQTAAENYTVYYKAISTNTDSCVDSAVLGPVNVTIGKAADPLVITPDSRLSKHYGGSDPILTYTVTAGLLGSDTSSVVSGTLKRASGENVGEYEISNNDLAAANYNIIVTTGVTFEITKASAPASTADGLQPSQKPTGPDIPYTGSAQNLLTGPSTPPAGYSVEYSMDGVTWSTTIPQATEDGDYTVYVRYVADDNHEPIEGTIEIPVNITVAATIGGNKYGTIDEAVTAWNANGGTLVLQEDISSTSTLNLTGSAERTLDLNGHSLTNTNGTAVSVSGGSLTVNNSGSGGSITGGGTGAGIEVSGSAGLTVSSGTVTSQSGYGITSSTSGALQITGSSSVGGNGVYLGTGSKIDLSQGLTYNKPVKVTMQTPGEFTVNGNYDSSTDAGYEAAESDFASGDGGYGISISNGQAALVEAVVYGGITVNGKPLNSSNIERLLPGITAAGGVTYTAGSPNTLTINGNYTIPEGLTIDVPAGTSIVIPSGNTLTNNGTISGAGTIQNNGSLVNNGTVNTTGVVNESGAALTNNTGGTMSGPVTNNGGEIINAGTLSGTVTNAAGTLNNNGTLSGTVNNASGALLNNNGSGNITGTITNAGTFDNAGAISGSAAVTNTGAMTNTGTIGGNATVTNTGTGTITNNGTINTTGSVTNDSGATITNNDGKTISSPVNNHGTIDNAGELSGQVTNDGTINNTGRLSGSTTNNSPGTINNNAGGDISGTLSNTTGGTVNNNEGAGISGNVNNAGTLTNDGTISGSGTVTNSGTMTNNGELSSTGGVNNTGTLTNNADKTITAPVNNSGNGIMNNNGTLSGAVSNTGNNSTINNAGDITGPVNNSYGGDINNSGTISGNLTSTGASSVVTNTATGTLSGNVNNGSASTLINNGAITGTGTVTNSGTMTNNNEISATGGINNTGSFTNSNGQTIAVPVNNSGGGSVINNGTISGDVKNSGEGSTVTNASTGTLSGNVNNGSGSTLNNSGAINGDGKTVSNSGTLNNNSGTTIAAPVNNNAGGMVNNSGTLAGNVTNASGATINNNGTINNGSNAGAIYNQSGGTIAGNLANTGAIVDNGGSTTGTVTGNGATVIPPNGGSIAVSPNGNVTVPEGTKIVTPTSGGGTKEVTVVTDDEHDTTYTIPANKMNQVNSSDTATTLPGGSSVTQDGETTSLPYGGSVSNTGVIKVNPKPTAPSSNSSSDQNNNEDSSSSASSTTASKTTGTTTGATGDATTDQNGAGGKSSSKSGAGESSFAKAEEGLEPETGAEEEPIQFGESREVTYGDGSIIVEVENVNEDGSKSAQTGYLSGDSKAIMEACLTEDELKAVAAGETAIIKLVVVAIGDNVPDTDREQIGAALESISDEPLTLGNYLDLSVLKKVGDGDWEKVPELAEELLITIDIEKELWAEGRVFYVLRSHEGAVTMLFDLDEEPETVTIKTGLFSTYALAYTDSAKTAEAIREAPDETKTQPAPMDEAEGQKITFPWWIIIIILLIAAVGAYIYYRRRGATSN